MKGKNERIRNTKPPSEKVAVPRKSKSKRGNRKEPELTPQASSYRPGGVLRGWRQTGRGALVYRVYPDGGFEVVGKIQDPDRLNAVMEELAEGLKQEQALLRHKKRRKGIVRREAQTPELFDTGGLAVKLENIQPLTGET